MKLTIDIQEHKADFVLELLRRLGDIVTIEASGVETLPAWHGHELKKRLVDHRQNQQHASQWSDIGRELENL